MYLFDMDGTLIDSNDVWKDVDREFLARRGLPYTKAYYEGVAHTIFPLAAKFTKEFCNLPDSEEDIMAEWMELAKDAYAHVTVKPGVRAFLKQCKAENRRMALVTSSVPVHCRTAMEKLDLMKYFESVTFAQELGIEKKDKRLWLGVAERYDVEPETCTLFDDSLAACKGVQAFGKAEDTAKQEAAGQLLFAAVNAARLAGVDAEEALTFASKRFAQQCLEQKQSGTQVE